MDASQEGDPFLPSQVSESHKVLNYKGNIVHDKQASTWPKVLRDRWMGVWLNRDDPDAALIHFCSPVCCVFKEWMSTWVFVPWFSCMCVSGGRSPIWYVCDYLYTSLCEYCISLCFCIPHVLLRLLAALCECVCVFVCICVDAGCTVDSALSDFVSGFLTHVLMAIKDFSLFGIYFFWIVFFF